MILTNFRSEEVPEVLMYSQSQPIACWFLRLYVVYEPVNAERESKEIAEC